MIIVYTVVLRVDLQNVEQELARRLDADTKIVGSMLLRLFLSL